MIIVFLGLYLYGKESRPKYWLIFYFRIILTRKPRVQSKKLIIPLQTIKLLNKFQEIPASTKKYTKKKSFIAVQVLYVVRKIHGEPVQVFVMYK